MPIAEMTAGFHETAPDLIRDWGQHQSARIPLSLITLPHFSNSLFR
jgi:hypothetical protein